MIWCGFDPNLERIRGERALSRATRPDEPLIIQSLRGRRPEKTAKVIIVGGRLAGLTAAYELERLGFEVLVQRPIHPISGAAFARCALASVMGKREPCGSLPTTS